MIWYDLTAESYASSDKKYAERNLDIKLRIRGLVSKIRPNVILDLGCGGGRYFPFLKGELMVGVDLSKGMLKEAKRFKHVQLIQADVYHLPFRESSFDLIISMSVIGECCPFNIELLKEISNILRSKGTFLFTVIPLHHLLLPSQKYLQFFIPFQFIQLMRSNTYLPHFGASKLQIIAILRKLELEICKIDERHGAAYPHFIVESYSVKSRE